VTTEPVSPDFLALQEAVAGRYSLERELGRGGMGIVYLAHEVSLDRPVALKLLPPGLAGLRTLRERFLQEARTAAKLSHPNIVPIHAVDEVDRFVFFAMAYVDGETLGERIRTRGPLPPQEAARVLREIAWALAYAHAQGVVHRDVKPDNVLMERESGRVLVTDFGIAHMRASGLTGQGEILGTAEFMSPEQASGEPVDARSDLYALGAVGYYAVSGRLPFTGETVPAVLAKQVTMAHEPLTRAAPETPRKLARAIERCLAKEPADRFASGEQLADALSQSSEAQRDLPVPLRVFIRKNRDAYRSSGAVTVLLFLTVPGISVGVVRAWGVPGLLMTAGALLSVVVCGPLAFLALRTRKLLKSGYGLDDIRLALKQDHQRRTEEMAFEHGKTATLLERITRWLGTGGLGVAAATAGLLLVFPNVVPPDLGWRVFGISFGTGVLSGLVAARRYERRIDVTGRRWLKFWHGKPGQWLARLMGRRLEAVPAAGGPTYRPTELAIGLAADRLYEALPDQVRRQLRDLPDTVRRLEADAQRMRQRVEELNDIVAAVGDKDRGAGQRRDALLVHVRATRDAAQQRLADAVAALETIRLDLLRLQAGAGNVASITQDLSAAREVSDEIGRLLAGRDEVERLLSDGS
jgi:serine/threonine-protein kinase